MEEGNCVKNENKELFESVPVGKALAIMAVPTIISQLITTIYNIADTVFIGMSNDPYKVAAASLAGVLFYIMNALANLFGVGGGSLISRMLGQKRETEAKKVVVFSIYGALVVALAYSVICMIFSSPLSRMLGASDNTIGYTKSYLLWVVVIGGIPATVGMTMSHLIRSAGYAQKSSTGLAIGGIANILLDPLFMFVILPKGNEVAGAAIATMLSNVVSMIYFICVIIRLKEKSVLSLSVKYIKPKAQSIKEIFIVGLPSALGSLLATAAGIVKNNLATSYNDVAMAALGIVVKIDMLPLNIGMGLCQGMMPLVAYNYASGNHKRMGRFTKAAQISGMAMAVIFIAVLEIFPSQIIRLFIGDVETISYGAVFLRIACVATPFMISNLQKIYCLQAMGKGMESLVLSVCRQGVLYIPILFLMNHIAGLYGVLATQIISDGITFIIAAALYRKVYNALLLEVPPI